MIPVLVKSFIKGINQSVDSQLIQIDEAVGAENTDISNGTLKRTSGSTQYITNSCPTGNIKSLMKYFNGSSSILVATSNGNIYKINGNNFQLITNGYSSDYFDYVNYQSGVNQIMIFANGLNPVKVYDGVTLRNLMFDGVSGTAPQGSLLEIHKERLWISGDWTSPNRLYFSTAFNPDDFFAPVEAETANTRGGFIDIPTWDEGSSIIALKSLFDQLIVFKKKNIFRLYGTYQGNFDMAQIFNTVNGEIIDKTIVGAENKAIWCTTEGLFHFDGINSVDLTPSIKDLYNSLNKAYIKNAVATLYKNTYYLAVPSNGSLYNDLVIEYNLTTGSFILRRGMIITSLIDFNGDLVYSSIDGKVYKYNSGNTYNGNLINSIWSSGRITLDRLDKKKFIQKVSFIGKGNGSIRIFLSNGIDTVSQDILLDNSAFKEYKIRLKCKGYYLTYSIVNLNGCDFEISQLQFNIELPS